MGLLAGVFVVGMEAMDRELLVKLAANPFRQIYRKPYFCELEPAGLNISY